MIPSYKEPNHVCVLGNSAQTQCIRALVHPLKLVMGKNNLECKPP